MFLGIVARASRHGITSSLLKWLVILSFPAFFRFAAGLGSKGEDTILSHLQCIQRRILVGTTRSSLDNAVCLCSGFAFQSPYSESSIPVTTYAHCFLGIAQLPSIVI